MQINGRKKKISEMLLLIALTSVMFINFHYIAFGIANIDWADFFQRDSESFVVGDQL